MTFPFPAEAVTELRILHITDTHILDSADDLLYGLNTFNNLQKVLRQALDDFPEVDLILFTGDISQTGSVSSYQLFHALIADLKYPILCLPGNHDDPRQFNEIIPDSPLDSLVVFQQNNFSIVLMHSWVDQAHHGELDNNCLNQLQHFLQTSPSRFHIFAIHHTPAPVNSPWLDNLGLKNQHRLLSLIQQSDTPSLLLSGHIHQPLDLQMNQLRLLATPSTCHQFKAQSESFLCLDQSFASYRYIKITLPDQIQTSLHYIDCADGDHMPGTRHSN